MYKLLATLILAASVGAARADLIDFEGHTPTNDGDVVQHQDGFTFTFSAQGWGIFEDSFVGGGAPYVQNGTARLVAAGGSPGSVTMTADDASLFSVSGFDGATMFPDFTGTLVVVGTFADATTISSFFDIFSDFSFYDLGSGFSNLVSISFSESVAGDFRRTSGFSLDNIHVNESVSVPEPAGVVLLGLGILGMSQLRRKRN
ncbi:PEP-CTERM sorting domain-containing protein [Permianibacter sp. IMCC34836]|uniref:PEP-CTERM sorting domain-containing protein n=1 Tax=Permianibacter fluminis TaxID=2738515 RepID=UPI001556EAED|nr:PEP-CTERM sorting domain-containing protein [Permianibacter fluminis]NQD38488.1 PEP-CTERM sorting domain-containing protein [Permianibacter fluminis]